MAKKCKYLDLCLISVTVLKYFKRGNTADYEWDYDV